MIPLKIFRASAIAVVLVCLLLTSCNENDTVNPATGHVSFSFFTAEATNGRVKDLGAKSILVTIKDGNGATTAEKKQMKLYEFNGEYLSEPLSLSIGNFKLVEFIILDKDDNIIYLTPIENSELAYLVNDPLPIDFVTSKDEVTTVVPEVITAEGHTAFQFGYVSFSFHIIGTLDFLSAAFKYNTNTNSLELTDHKLTVTAGLDTLYDAFKQNATTLTVLKDSYTSYTLTFSKAGYDTIYRTLSKSDLLNYQVTPLTFIFIESNLANGLVAHYTFANGSMEDFSVNNNTGILSGATAFDDRLGNHLESMKFNSADDYIKVSNPSFRNNDKGTFAAWVKFDDLGHTQYVGSVSDENSIESYISFLRMDETSHTIGIYQREAGLANWVQGTKIIQAGVYYHLVMISDGLKWKIYINGVEETLHVVNGTNSGKWISQLVNIDNFVIGSTIIQPPFTIPYLSGKIDEVRVYNRPLSAFEIETLYYTTK